MINILFIGDINGKIGRKTVAKILPKLKKDKTINLVIANADNIAHGNGITENTLKELMDAGIDFFTNGDHAFDKIKQLDCYDKFPLIRPANFSADAPGKGYDVVAIGKHKILIINLIGRVFMKGNQRQLLVLKQFLKLMNSVFLEQNHTAICQLIFTLNQGLAG